MYLSVFVFVRVIPFMKYHIVVTIWDMQNEMICANCLSWDSQQQIISLQIEGLSLSVFK